MQENSDLAFRRRFSFFINFIDPGWPCDAERRCTVRYSGLSLRIGQVVMRRGEKDRKMDDGIEEECRSQEWKSRRRDGMHTE